MSLLEEFIGNVGFDKLNIVTKYPKILPFHQVKDKQATSILSTADYQPVPIQTDKMEVEVSELIDGKLTRMIILGDDFVIADMNEIVHARGDRVVTNDVIGPTYHGLMSFMNSYSPSEERFLILYGVVYGEQLAGYKRYTNINKSGYALIDGFTVKVDDMQKLCINNSLEQLENWSDTLKAPFWSISTRDKFASSFKLMLAPKLKTLTLDKIPNDPKKTLNWLWEFTSSKVVLDTDDEQEKYYSKKNSKEPDIDPIPGNNAISRNDDAENDFLDSMVKDKKVNKFKMKKGMLGKSKGIVIRNSDRSYIRKLSFEDYIHLKKKK